jgi:hypothetical protein
MEPTLQPEDEVVARKNTRSAARWMIFSGIAYLGIGGEGTRQILFRHKSLDPLQLAIMGASLLLALGLLYRGVQFLRFASRLKSESESPVSQ